MKLLFELNFMYSSFQLIDHLFLYYKLNVINNDRFYMILEKIMIFKESSTILYIKHGGE